MSTTTNHPAARVRVTYRPTANIGASETRTVTVRSPIHSEALLADLAKAKLDLAPWQVVDAEVLR